MTRRRGGHRDRRRPRQPRKHSWAEAEWMARFRALVAGRTALVITHRFTTAMRADVIHVMEAGRIVESGSHGELVARGGRYAQAWQEQVQEAPKGSPHRTVLSPESAWNRK